ncbi:MAG TPA: efflux RND transporter periplasmic adaptor subunit [Gemmatimonadales bacterium]
MAAIPLVLALVLAACGSETGEAASVGGAGGGPRAPRAVPVEVVVAEYGTAARTVPATGNVEPLRTVGVNSQLAGVLSRVNVEEGDVVQEGAVLATIEIPELHAQLASAEAALEVARSAAERSAQLFQRQVITAAEKERDQAALTAARATRDQLRTRLGYATVRAPISGVVTEKRVESGDLASAQGRLFTIADVSTLVVRVPVSELDVTALRAGDEVDVVLDALPGQPVRGTVRRVFPVADSITRLVPVEVALSGATARQVRPGFLARVTFRLSPRDGVLMVPVGAVLENPRGAAVYIVNDGRATLRSVQRGGTYEGRVEITSGLAPGDSVVVAGNTMLRDGAEVRVSKSAQPTVTPSPDAAGQQVGGIGANVGGRQ